MVNVIYIIWDCCWFLSAEKGEYVHEFFWMKWRTTIVRRIQHLTNKLMDFFQKNKPTALLNLNNLFKFWKERGKWGDNMRKVFQQLLYSVLNESRITLSRRFYQFLIFFIYRKVPVGKPAIFLDFGAPQLPFSKPRRSSGSVFFFLPRNNQSPPEVFFFLVRQIRKELPKLISVEVGHGHG